MLSELPITEKTKQNKEGANGCEHKVLLIQLWNKQMPMEKK